MARVRVKLAPRDLHSATKMWLRELGAEPEDADRRTNAWHIVSTYPPTSDHHMHIIGPSEKPWSVIIASVLSVTASQRDAFTRLDEPAKTDLFWALRFSLMSVYTDYRLEGINRPGDFPSRIVTSAVRFDDGLTLDSFAHTLGAVFKNELTVALTIDRHLAPRDGNRRTLDFKRLEP